MIDPKALRSRIARGLGEGGLDEIKAIESVLGSERALKPLQAGDFVQVSDISGSLDYGRDPDSPYYATPLFLAGFRGSPLEIAVTATLIEIRLGNYPTREVLNGAYLQLPGGASVDYNIYNVGPEDDVRIANIPGSNIFYLSPYHYRPGPGVPNEYVEITLY